MNQTKYAYTVGRIRAKEVKLLDENKVTRMVDATSFESAFEILAESDYVEHFGKISGSKDFEKALELEWNNVKKLIKTLAPDFEKDSSKTIFLKNYLKAKTDLEKIKTAILEKRTEGKDKLEEWLKTLKYTPYLKILENGLDFYFKNNSFSELEKLMDNFLINYYKRARYINLGVEPLIAYEFAKETEIKTIRTILVGKLNNLPTSTIKEHLRETYV